MKNRQKSEAKNDKYSQANWISITSTWVPIIIALCSLILAIHEGYEARKFKRLSVMPELLVSFYHNNKGAGWHLFNGGLGPARIKWFKITVDGYPKKIGLKLHKL
jgi:lipoprotein signal peptidase